MDSSSKKNEVEEESCTTEQTPNTSLAVVGDTHNSCNKAQSSSANRNEVLLHSTCERHSTTPVERVDQPVVQQRESNSNPNSSQSSVEHVSYEQPIRSTSSSLPCVGTNAASALPTRQQQMNNICTEQQQHTTCHDYIDALQTNINNFLPSPSQVIERDTLLGQYQRQQMHLIELLIAQNEALRQQPLNLGKQEQFSEQITEEIYALQLRAMQQNRT
jgi:hypothetical protein